MAKVDCLPTPRSLTEPSPPSSPCPHSRKSTLHQIPLQEAAGCGAFSKSGHPDPSPSLGPDLPPTLWTVAPALSLPPSRRAGLTAYTPSPHPALPLSRWGCPLLLLLHELEGPCELCPVPHPIAPPILHMLQLPAAPPRPCWRPTSDHALSRLSTQEGVRPGSGVPRSHKGVGGLSPPPPRGV